MTACYEVTQGDIFLTLVNSGRAASKFTVTDNSYGHSPQVFVVPPGSTVRRGLSLEASHSWYDLIVTSDADPAFVRHFAGHVETGRPSVTDPTLSTGAVAGTGSSGSSGPVLFEVGPECQLHCAAL